MPSYLTFIVFSTHGLVNCNSTLANWHTHNSSFSERNKKEDKIYIRKKKERRNILPSALNAFCSTSAFRFFLHFSVRISWKGVSIRTLSPSCRMITSGSSSSVSSESLSSTSFSPVWMRMNWQILNQSKFCKYHASFIHIKKLLQILSTFPSSFASISGCAEVFLFLAGILGIGL